MIDEFGDAISALNKAARDLLEDAHELDDEIKRAESGARLDKLKSLTQRLCQGMRVVVDVLDPPASPNKPESILDRFSRKTGEVVYTAKSKKVLDEFLRDHEEALRKLGANENAIRKLKDALRAEGGARARTVQSDPKRLMKNVRDLQKLICKSAEFIDQLSGATNMLKGAVNGAMGVATIVVDITGVLTIPDICGIVIFKAVKSTILGGNMVRKAVGAMKKGFAKVRLRRKPAAEETKAEPPSTQAAPPSSPPAPPKSHLPPLSTEQRKRWTLGQAPKDKDKEG